MKPYLFADLHCHPNLKTFGQSFSNSKRRINQKSCLWYQKFPNFYLKLLQKAIGITRFTQSDFATMAEANVKIAFVSLYPFEKGFFINRYLNNKLSAVLSNFITSIGYKRVRNIQNHKSYFEDLLKEFHFLVNGLQHKLINGTMCSWDFANNLTLLNDRLKIQKHVSVIPTIEGAHVFNSGLTEYGVTLDVDEILQNIQVVKNLTSPPFFITFAHNFNNDLCGHAPSLKVLGSLVDQSKNLGLGFSKLGLQVLRELLNDTNGKRILIDVKHMSLKSRLEYYKILEKEYQNKIPVIVSHGAVTGTSLEKVSTGKINSEFFVDDSINFYDEELIKIAKSKGLFAIQFDAKRLAPQKLIKKSIFSTNRKEILKQSALIIWRQLQHVAEILDAEGLYAWDTCCIGSDFDGTITPLNEIWTAADFEKMAIDLEKHANEFLKDDSCLRLEKNRSISPNQIILNFSIDNCLKFLKRFYN